MKINKNNLQEALQIVKPGLDSKELISQASSFAFLDGRVITYNDEISISHPVEGVNFEGAVKAEELYGLLTKLTHEEITIKVEEGELLINSGRVKAGLCLEEEVSLPPQEVEGKWKKIKDPKQFKEFLLLAAQTCSSDMSDPKMTCVSVRGNTITGSDNHRLIQCTLSEDFPTKDFLIPASSVFNVTKIEPTAVQLKADWIHFKNKSGSIFSCRRVNDVYIEATLIELVLETTGHTAIDFPIKILDVLSRVIPFSKRSFVMDETVEIDIKKGKATLKASTEDTKSWIKEKFTIKSDVSLGFKITPSLFIDILKKTQKCYLDKTRTKVKFTLKDKWDYVIMLKQPEGFVESEEEDDLPF